MKKIFRKTFDFGDIDLNKLMSFLFILGMIVILVGSFSSANINMLSLTISNDILIENGDELIREVVYEKKINVEYILKWLFALFFKIITLRISLEIVFIVLKGFKDLSNLKFLQDNEGKMQKE